MLKAIRRWNESYWCRKCRTNVHVDDTINDIGGSIYYYVEEYNELCPHCKNKLNMWSYGYFEDPETKSERLRLRFAMWRNGLLARPKWQVQRFMRWWQPCTECGKRCTHKAYTLAVRGPCMRCTTDTSAVLF